MVCPSVATGAAKIKAPALSSTATAFFLFDCMVSSSMGKRVELPVGAYLPPAVRQSIRLENQEKNDHGADRHFTQEHDALVQRQQPVDGASRDHLRQSAHRFGQEHHEDRAHQSAHDGAEAADDDHGEELDREKDI